MTTHSALLDSAEAQSLYLTRAQLLRQQFLDYLLRTRGACQAAAWRFADGAPGARRERAGAARAAISD